MDSARWGCLACCLGQCGGVLCVGRANVCCCKECRMSGGLGGSCVGEDGVGWGEVCGDVVWGGVLWGGVQRGGVG